MERCENDVCGLDKFKKVIQLHDKDKFGKEYPIFPVTYTHAVYDKNGASLESMLAQFNNVFLQYQGTAKDTRLLLPKEMRRKGIQITYRNMDDEAVTEKCVNDSQSDNDHWGLDANWMRIDELSLQGDISVSKNGTWVINGTDTGVKALGPKGDNGLTPWVKTIDNKLYYSYDNKTWELASDYIAAWFRFTGTAGSSQAGNIGKIQISRDEGNTWADLSGEFTNDLKIRGYRTSVELIPAGQPQGAIWGIGPTYAESDTEHTNPIYRLHVKDGSGWVDNGQFTAVAAGVVQGLGDSETEVISQKTITRLLNEGYLYAGIATPDTNPSTPEGKVFYLAEEGTYPNFPIANGNASVDVGQLATFTWDSLFSRWNVSTIEIGSASEIINVNEFTGSSDTYTFETARAAITNNKLRKPGTIITYKVDTYQWEAKQFIGSVVGFWDNDGMWKDVITTRELDDKIQTNNKLLNSDIIKLLVNKVNVDFGKNLFNPKTRTTGYLNSIGVIQDSNGYFTTNYIDVSTGINLIANNSNPAGTYNVVYDKNGSVLRNFSGAAYTYQEGDAYVRFSQQASLLNAFQIEIGVESTAYISYTETDTIDSSINTLQNDKVDKTLYNLLDFEAKGVTKNKYINSNGREIDFSASDISDYIKIPDDHVITHNLPKYAANIGYYGVYDEDKALIRTIIGGEQYQYQEGDYYIRFGYNHDQIGIGMAVNDEKLPTEYIPYLSVYNDIMNAQKMFGIDEMQATLSDLMLRNEIVFDSRLWKQKSYSPQQGATINGDTFTIPDGSTGSSSFVAIAFNPQYNKNWLDYVGKTITFNAVFDTTGLTAENVANVSVNITGKIESSFTFNDDRIVVTFSCPLITDAISGTIQFNLRDDADGVKTITFSHIYYSIDWGTEYPMTNAVEEIANEKYREITYSEPIIITVNSDENSDADFKGTDALRNAIASIIDASKYNRYKILATGTFEATKDSDYNIQSQSWYVYLVGKSYVDVVGAGNFKIVCRRDNTAEYGVMPVDWSVNANLENCTIESYVGGAYGIHIEGANSGISESKSNLNHVKTLKNVTIKIMDDSNASVLGIGLYEGEIIHFENCRFFGNNGVYCHNNNYYKTAGLEFINCDFNITKKDNPFLQPQDITTNGGHCQTYISCIGCKFNGLSYINYLTNSNIADNYRLYLDCEPLLFSAPIEDAYPSFSGMNYVKNTSENEIPLGCAVTLTEYNEVRLAKSTDENIAGIAVQAIAPSSFGKIIRKGKIFTANHSNSRTNIFKIKETNAADRNFGDKLVISSSQDGYFELYSGSGNIVANIIGKNILELTKG